MIQPEGIRQRIAALQDQHELVRTRVEQFRLRERIAEQQRLAAGQEQAAANRARREEAEHLERLEREVADLRRQLASRTPGPNEVTDRAVVAWLERVEGFDVAAVRERILRAAAEATPDGQERGMRYLRHRSARLVVREGRVVTVLD